MEKINDTLLGALYPKFGPTLGAISKGITQLAVLTGSGIAMFGVMKAFMWARGTQDSTERNRLLGAQVETTIAVERKNGGMTRISPVDSAKKDVGGVSKAAKIGGGIAMAGGTALSMFASHMESAGGAADTMSGKLGIASMKIAGTTAQFAGMGTMFAGPVGAAAGAIFGLAVGLVQETDSIKDALRDVAFGYDKVLKTSGSKILKASGEYSKGMVEH